jgi:hypothetical protein
MQQIAKMASIAIQDRFRFKPCSQLTEPACDRDLFPMAQALMPGSSAIDDQR